MSPLQFCAPQPLISTRNKSRLGSTSKLDRSASPLQESNTELPVRRKPTPQHSCTHISQPVIDGQQPMWTDSEDDNRENRPTPRTPNTKLLPKSRMAQSATNPPLPSVFASASPITQANLQTALSTPRAAAALATLQKRMMSTVLESGNTDGSGSHSLTTLTDQLLLWEDRLSEWKRTEEQRIQLRFRRLQQQKQQWEEHVKQQTEAIEQRDRRSRQREQETNEWIQERRQEVREEDDRRAEERGEETKRRDEETTRLKQILEQQMRDAQQYDESKQPTENEVNVAVHTQANGEGVHRRRLLEEQWDKKVVEKDEASQAVVMLHERNLNEREITVQRLDAQLQQERAVLVRREQALAEGEARLTADRAELEVKAAVVEHKMCEATRREEALQARTAAADRREEQLSRSEQAIQTAKQQMELAVQQRRAEMDEVEQQARLFVSTHFRQLPSTADTLRRSTPSSRATSATPSSSPHSSSLPLASRSAALFAREAALSARDADMCSALVENERLIAEREEAVRSLTSRVDDQKAAVSGWWDELRVWEERLSRREEECVRKERHLSEYLHVFHPLEAVKEAQSSRGLIDDGSNTLLLDDADELSAAPGLLDRDGEGGGGEDEHCNGSRRGLNLSLASIDHDESCATKHFETTPTSRCR